MRIACPHCQATYEIDASLAQAIFVCHRCARKFRAVEDEEEPPERIEPEEQLPLFSETGKARPEQPTISEPAPEPPEPAPIPDAEPEPGALPDNGMPITAKRKRLWPWFAAVLSLIIVLGFVLQKEQWLDNRWFRSTAMNLGLPLAMRDKDWRVIPESVHAEWIVRDDRSRALLIEGRVENLLASEQPPPKIEVTFFDAAHPERILLSRLHEITLPPTMDTVRHAPYATPDRDIIPVAPLGQRGFILVLESLPESTGEFALTARAPGR